MSKRPTPNFKAATYVDIQKHWRRLGPIYKSPKAFAIWKPCMVEFAQVRAHDNGGKFPHQEQERHQWPSGYDSCDWKWDRKGIHPAFWKYTCAGACHWLADLALFVATSAWPKTPWRIIRAKKHSTVWNGDLGKPVLFDANFLAFDTKPSEPLEIAWTGVHYRPAKFSKHYLHHQAL